MSRRTLAVIGLDDGVAQPLAHAIRSTGARCRVLSPSAEAAAELAGGGFDAVVLAELSPNQRARVLSGVAHGARPRIVATSTAAQLPRRGADTIDAIALVPAHPSVVLYATGLWPGGRDGELSGDPAQLMGASALAHGPHPVEAALRTIAAAYGAVAAVFAAPTGETHCALVDDDARLRARTLERARVAQRSAIPVVGETVATADAGVDTAVAAGGLCLLVPGVARVGPAERRVLRALSQRLAAEVSHRALQRRLVFDLAACRAGGGMDSRLGVWARPAVERLFDLLVAHHRRARRPAAVAVVDVRGMAGINDRWGHDAGDAVLRHVAQQTRAATRAEDAVGHLGGDDVAIFFGGATPADAERAVGRIRARIAESPVRAGRGEIAVDVSAGIVAVRPDEPVDRLLARASRAVERARDEGEPVRVQLESDPGRGGTSTPAAAERVDVDGEILAGAYHLRHEISSGGVGVVYRADDLALRRPVAIKVLRPDLAGDQTFVERFRDEAAILASLRHPNVVQVYAAGVDDGRVFFAMELVEGQSVADAVDAARRDGVWLPAARVASVMAQLGGALAALHQRGVLHRDVKPANVLLDPFRERAVLVDVGLARRRGDSVDVAGTPGYVAPEVLDCAQYSAATDVYGLAVTAYEMLALQLPWPDAGDPLDLVRMQREVAPVPLRELRPDLPAAVDAAVMRGLARDPAARWQTAAAMTDVLVDALAGVGGAPADAELPPPQVRATDATCVDLADPGSTEQPYTRGIVFRTLARVLGPRAADEWRQRLVGTDGRFAEALSPTTSPLRWLPTEVLVALLHASPPGDRTAVGLGHELGRASVRATFRRFFPASSATLVPSGTLAALPHIWQRYHSWGRVEIVPRGEGAADVRVVDAPRDDGVRAWVQGMLEQVIVLSGGADVSVAVVDSDPAGGCTYGFRARWQMRERRDRREVSA